MLSNLGLTELLHDDMVLQESIFPVEGEIWGLSEEINLGKLKLNKEGATQDQVE